LTAPPLGNWGTSLRSFVKPCNGGFPGSLSLNEGDAISRDEHFSSESDFALTLKVASGAKDDSLGCHGLDHAFDRGIVDQVERCELASVRREPVRLGFATEEARKDMFIQKPQSDRDSDDRQKGPEWHKF
jgi:hypothetical protein